MAQSTLSAANPVRKKRTSPGAATKWLAEFFPSGDDCIEWPFGKTRGYAVLRVHGRTVIISRHVCEKHNGPAPSVNHQAAHNCGNRSCVNPTHIRWATRLENEADKIIHGTRPKGDSATWSKLTDAQVAFIRKSNLRQIDLAAMFDVTQSAISRAKRSQRLG